MNSKDDKITMLDLQCSNGAVFPVELDVLQQFNTVGRLIENLNLNDDERVQIPVPIRDVIFQKVLTWSEHHREEWSELEKNENNLDICEWDRKLMEKDNEALFELFVAADYLDVKGLLSLCAKIVAEQIDGKTPDQIRRVFGIENDFSVEERKKIHMMNDWIKFSETDCANEVDGLWTTFRLLDLPRLPLLEIARKLNYTGRWGMAHTCQRLQSLLVRNQDPTLSMKIVCTKCSLNFIAASNGLQRSGLSTNTLFQCFEDVQAHFQEIRLHVTTEEASDVTELLPSMEKHSVKVKIVLWPVGYDESEIFHVEGAKEREIDDSAERMNSELAALTYFLENPSIRILRTLRKKTDSQWWNLRKHAELLCAHSETVCTTVAMGIPYCYFFRSALNQSVVIVLNQPAPRKP